MWNWAKTEGKARQNEYGMIQNILLILVILNLYVGFIHMDDVWMCMDDVNTFSQKQLKYFAITC